MKNIKYFFLKTPAAIRRIVLLTLSFILKFSIPIKRGRVICWSDNYHHYSCNPKYISEYIACLSDQPFELIWVFKKKRINEIELPASIKKIAYNTLSYLYYLNSSEFIITNQRPHLLDSYWSKRIGQKYVMTWHASMGNKKVEKDSGTKKLEFNIKDSDRCDLMISNSKWFSNQLRESFMYKGEILETGTPRNDIFYNSDLYNSANKKVRSTFNVGSNDLLLFYAPTFRQNLSVEPYITKWEDIIKALKERYNRNVKVMVRLHPNLLESDISAEFFKDSYVINGTNYDDMQELLCAADILISDYSSCMFDFALAHKPCFMYAPDLDTYDRDAYYPIRTLPFPLSENISELVDSMSISDTNSIVHRQISFINDKFCPIATSRASQRVFEWMIQHQLQ